LGALVLLVGFSFRAFNVPLPVLSLAGTLSCCVMGYGILSRQMFNPLREQTTALQHEIAERHRIEEALRESEARFRSIFEQSSDAVVLCSEEGHIVDWNHATEQLTGLKRTDVLGQFYWDIQFKLMPAARATPAAYERLRSMMRETLRTGRADWMRQLLEGEINLPDGGRRYFQQAAFPIQTAKGFMISSITRDITERKRAEEKLQMFQYTIDRASDAVQWLNREGGFEYVNDQACRSLGYTRDELLRLRLWDIDPIYPQERWSQNWESYQDGRLGGSENIDSVHRRKDGSTFPVEVSSNHLWFGDRELHVAIVRDITERQRTEEALRRTQFAVDRAKDAIHWVDADGKLVYVNDSTCTSLGYTREELLAMTIFDIDPVFPKEAWLDHWRKMSDLGSYMFETVHQAKDGHTFQVEVSIDVMRFGGKEFHSVYARDITERKQTEQIVQLRLKLMEFAATHSLEELLQKTLDEVGELTNSPIGFYHFVEADQRTLSLQAWSTRTLDEFCQAEGQGLHYPIDQAGVWTDCVRERRPVIHNDYAALPHRKGLPEGHAQVMRELVVPILRGARIVAILGVGNKAQAYTEKDVEVVSYVADVAWEITERRRAEEELVRLAKFPSENPYPVLRLDRAGIVLYANKASLGLLADWGCAVGEPAPEFWRDVVTEALVKYATRVVETQSGGRIYSVSVVPIVDANYVNLYGSNITERKQAESEREALIRELEAKNAELERFTYTVSHDLKSPLITMRGFLGLLEKDALAGDVGRMQTDMKRIVEATNKMQRLLNELLELSRVGRMMNPPEVVPFEVIVHEAIELVHGQLEMRGVRVDVAADLPVIYGDRARLVEVIQNLVDNACKFMGDQPEPRITIGRRGTDRDGKPIVFVRDNGIGIDPQFHDNVFGLFNKLDPEAEGTGVGLALVKRIVEVHGGRIWVESQGAGTGTTFCFTFPVAEAGSEARNM
jgi:PAS domain S-box-containing protein